MARAKKTRNGGTWTEAKYWGVVRSHLRNAFRYWVPMKKCKEKARRLNQSGFLSQKGKPVKWEVQCAACKEWFPENEWVTVTVKDVEVRKWRSAIQCDHVVPAGSLNADTDLTAFLARLTEEDESAYQMLCTACHRIKTNEERSK